MFLDHNSLTGSAEPICDGASEDLEFLSADTTVSECDCCDVYCEESDDTCNPTSDTVKKFDTNFISRISVAFSENFKLADVDSPED